MPWPDIGHIWKLSLHGLVHGRGAHQELLLRLLPLPRPQGRDGGREADGAAGVAVKAAAAGGGARGDAGAPRGAVKAVAEVDAGSSDSSKASSD